VDGFFTKEFDHFLTDEMELKDEKS